MRIRLPTETPLKIRSDLQRYPKRKKELLQAWDSADELILEHLSEIDLSEKRILVVNDSFGALSTAIAEAGQRSGDGLDLTAYTDSYVSARGIAINSQERVQPIHLLSALSGKYDIALIRIPKNLSFFEDILRSLSQHLAPGAQIICGYMIKHQANTAFDLLNKIIGETRTSLAKKKARLIFASFEREPTRSPYPIQVSIEGFEKPFTHHSNLFSREKLDIGTRFLLEHLPEGEFETILDLGCANGIVGIAAKLANPSARILFSDDSMMAIESARANYGAYFQDEAIFQWTNCYENPEPSSVDLVICNPPFHQGNTLGDFIAWQMFTDAKRALKDGGTLRVIGNSHLQYPGTLKRIFGGSEIAAKNAKFTIVDAVK